MEQAVEEMENGLFAWRTLFSFACDKCAFRENGRRACVAAASSSSDTLQLCLLDGPEPRADKCIPLLGGAVLDMCFDPSAEWLLALQERHLKIVPARAFLEPHAPHDCRWPLDDITSIPLDVASPTAVVWWQTEASEATAIVGDQTGGLTFVSLDTGKVIGKSYIVGKIFRLTLYVDDGLDSVVLLITSSKNRQWNLTLEKRFKKDDRLGDKKKAVKGKESNKKLLDEFLTTLKTSLWPESNVQKRSQSTSNVPDKLSAAQSKRKNPTPISFPSPDDDKSSDLPAVDEFDVRPGQAKWSVEPQNSNGRHLVSVFNSNHSSLTLHHSMEDKKPVYSFKFRSLPAKIVKILWHQRIVYVFGTNQAEVHSSFFATNHSDDSHTVVWEGFLDDDEEILDAWNLNDSSAPSEPDSSWVPTTDISELNIPRFSLGSALVVTNKRTYLLGTRRDPAEWVVEQLIKGRGGMERMAAGLMFHLQPLLIAAADIMLTKHLILEALGLYNLGKLPPDDILCRLGALGHFREIIACGYEPRRSYSANICVLNHAMHSLMNSSHRSTLLAFLRKNNEYELFPALKLFTDLGLWDAVETISLKSGDYWVSFQNLMAQRSYSPCRGFFSVLLNKHYSQFLVAEEALPLLKYIDQYCEKFDTTLLKALCLWMCPLQDCFRILYRALCTGQYNYHLSGMRRLIKTFFGVVSTLHSRTSFPKMDIPLLCNVQIKPSPSEQSICEAENLYGHERYPYSVSCGHNRWGVTAAGNAKLSINGVHPNFIDLDLNLLGKALTVSCGREHVLILTENGLYSFGNNRYGQLGIGSEVTNISVIPTLVGVTNKEAFDGTFAWHHEKIVQIAAGQYHSACVTDQGDLYTWGWGIHGQLAHGSIFNEFVPRKVTRLPNEKVKIVGCGSCHTAILTLSGSVYLCGNGSFGQIGNSTKQKSNVPLKVDLGIYPAVNIAVGYFHTLALLNNNELWTWGSSPQKIRLGARSAKRKANAAPTESQDDSCVPTQPSSPLIEEDTHLYPTRVDTSNVTGKIVKLAAGWLHSCLIDSFGHLYVWGLNLDCQLGTGNRNEVFIPTQMHFEGGSKADSSKNLTDDDDLPIVGCGGDFTVFVNTDGKVYVAGNACVEEGASNKGKLYFVKFKNTTRKIRLPPPSHVNQFKHITDIPVSAANSPPISPQKRPSFNWPHNPLSTWETFDDPIWSYKVLVTLHGHINDDTPLVDNYLRALFSSLRGDYAEALNLHLNSAMGNAQDTVAVPKYLQHGRTGESSDSIVEVLRERIRRQCMTPTADHSQSGESTKFDCQCNEVDYIRRKDEGKKDAVRSDDVASYVVDVTKRILSSLPHDNNVWTECVNEATVFWLDHGLNMNDLEKILMDRAKSGNCVEMASAIFCSRNKIDYQRHLSSNFNLELCENIMESC